MSREPVIESGDKPAERESTSGVGRAPAGLGTGLLCLVLLAVFLLPMRYGNHLHMHNEAIRIYAAEALVLHGTACLNPVFDTYYPGFLEAGLVPNVDASLRGECYLLDKAPLLSWLAVPVVWITAPLGLGGPSGHAQLTWLLVLLWVAIPLTASLAFMRSRLKRTGLPGPEVDLCIVAVTLGTAVASYGGLYYGHGLSAALLTSGVLLLVSPRGDASAARERRDVLAGGALLGLSVLADYPMAIVVVATGVLLAVHPDGRRRLPWFVLGGLPAAGALLLWNTIVFGGPFAMSYDFKQHDDFADVIATGAYGIHPLGLRHLPKLLIGPERGLLFLSPWLLAAGAGVAMLLRGGLDVATGLWRWWLALILPVSFLCIGAFEDWEAGRGMGPRHWVPLVPLLAAPAAIAMARVRAVRSRVFLAALVPGLIILSVLAHVLSAGVFPHFPQSIRNPLAEIVIPVLILDGPARSVFGGWASWPMLVLMVTGGVALVLRCSWWWLDEMAVPRSVLWLSFLVVLVGAMLLVGPHTPGPGGRLLVLQEQRLVMELRGSEESARRLRREVEHLIHERNVREGGSPAAPP